MLPHTPKGVGCALTRDSAVRAPASRRPYRTGSRLTLAELSSVGCDDSIKLTMERAQKLVQLVTEGSISQLLLFADDKITLVSFVPLFPYITPKPEPYVSRVTMRISVFVGQTMHSSNASF